MLTDKQNVHLQCSKAYSSSVWTSERHSLQRIICDFVMNIFALSVPAEYMALTSALDDDLLTGCTAVTSDRDGDLLTGYMAVTSDRDEDLLTGYMAVTSDLDEGCISPANKILELKEINLIKVLFEQLNTLHKNEAFL